MFFNIFFKKLVFSSFNFVFLQSLKTFKMTCTETVYIEGATGLTERLARINAIILALELRAVENVGDAFTDEYQIDDGQIKIRTKYRSFDAITKAIFGFEQIKNKLLNKLNGRGMVLRPWQGLN